MRISRFFLLIAGCLLVGHLGFGQGTIFASLTGSPTINTTGWNLTGNAQAGDTPGDADNFSNELIVCPNTAFTSGGIFYSTPANLGACNRFTVEFEFRIFDGSSADGLAFCFLVNPPTGFVNGGGIGIPSNPQGLMVVFDTFDNCGQNNNPEVQIRTGNGTSNYNECPTPPQPTAFSQSYLRSSGYQQARIEYNGGQIQVYVNNVLRLSGNAMVNYTGYFGFTASTGQSTDNHSIRNVFIRNYRPFAFGGGSQTACSGDSLQLGDTNANPAFTYSWTPTSGLNNAAIAAPKLALSNTGSTPQSFTYILRVDSPGNACPGYDTIQITIEPRPGLPVISGDSVLCEGESLSLTAANFTGAQYVWGSGPFLAGPGGNTLNFGPINQTFNGPLYAVAIIGNCNSDTARINIQVNPKPVTPSVRGVRTACETDFLSWDAIGNGQANWIGPNGFSSQVDPLVINSLQTNQSGLYQLWMVNNGCVSDTLDLNLTVNANPKPELGPDREFCPDSLAPIVLNPGVFLSYQWNTGSTLSTQVADTAGKYSVSVTDVNGCVGSDDIVLVEKCPFSLMMPTIFSPNDDGLNDYFRGFAKGVSSLNMRIYDRWGNMVYEAAQRPFKFDTFPWWNGSWKNEGAVVQFGRYIWVADIISDKGENERLKGAIQIVE